MNQLVVGSIVMGVYKCIMQVHVYVYTCRYELAESVDLYCSGLVQWNRENQEHTHKYAQNVPADACNRTTCMRPRIQNCRDQMAGNYLVVARPRHLLKTKGKRYISTSIVLGDMCISAYQCL